jgi:hypothetical protein
MMEKLLFQFDRRDCLPLIGLAGIWTAQVVIAAPEDQEVMGWDLPLVNIISR